jgi:phosphosulfolactate phosphohydrolase-like enzyme
MSSAEIDQCLAEIAFTEKQIAAAQQESTNAAEVLRQAKAKEAVLAASLSNLKFKVSPTRTLSSFPNFVVQVNQLRGAEVQQQIDALSADLHEKAAAAAQMQKALEDSVAEEAAIRSKIEQLAKMGDAAGKKQVGVMNSVPRGHDRSRNE